MHIWCPVCFQPLSLSTHHPTSGPVPERHQTFVSLLLMLWHFLLPMVFLYHLLDLAVYSLLWQLDIHYHGMVLPLRITVHYLEHAEPELAVLPSFDQTN